jgi:hypothetical protein
LGVADPRCVKRRSRKGAADDRKACDPDNTRKRQHPRLPRYEIMEWNVLLADIEQGEQRFWRRQATCEGFQAGSSYRQPMPYSTAERNPSSLEHLRGSTRGQLHVIAKP